MLYVFKRANSWTVGVTSLQYVFSILWLRLGLKQVVETTDTRLPLWLSEDGAQDTAAVLESSSRMLTACGRSRSSSNSSPPGPGTISYV